MRVSTRRLGALRACSRSNVAMAVESSGARRRTTASRRSLSCAIRTPSLPGRWVTTSPTRPLSRPMQKSRTLALERSSHCRSSIAITTGCSADSVSSRERTPLATASQLELRAGVCARRRAASSASRWGAGSAAT